MTPEIIEFTARESLHLKRFGNIIINGFYHHLNVIALFSLLLSGAYKRRKAPVIMEASFDDMSKRPPFSTAIKTISYRCVIIVLLWLPVFLVCVPLYLLGLSIWGLPPMISPWSRFVKYFVAAFTAGRADDNIPFTNRVSVFLIVLTALLKVPLNGIYWFIDELFFPKYHEFIIEEPVFFITGCRTGSTQLAYNLKDDKMNFIAPTDGESMFPFIWYWKLIVPALIFAGMKKKGHAKTNKDFSHPQKELDKRHNADRLRTGSFEICAAFWHFSLTSWYLGVDFMKWGYAFVNPIDQPTDNQFSSSFTQYYDSVVKKVLYHRGTSTQRPLVKGHFLMVADELAQRYKGAKFFTVVRD